VVLRSETASSSSSSSSSSPSSLFLRILFFSFPDEYKKGQVGPAM
jgi:hypothetical protein